MVDKPISVKRQTNRCTQWYREWATNINMFVEGVEIGATTTEGWGDFSEAKTKIQVSFKEHGGEKNYSLTVDEFKQLFSR